jgi:AcrR family transcriptional regulator
MATRGRPRTFDEDTALDGAMRVFWERGFEASGVDDLAKAMGISMSTFYSIFGDKEALFLSALKRYEEEKRGYANSVLSGDQPAAVAFQALLDEAAHQLTREDQPRGCMLTLALHNCSPELEPLRSHLNGRRTASVDAFVLRLKAARSKSEFEKGTDIRGLAWFLTNTLQGMSLLARAGATREDLLKIGRWAMKAWPQRTGEDL